SYSSPKVSQSIMIKSHITLLMGTVFLGLSVAPLVHRSASMRTGQPNHLQTQNQTAAPRRISDGMEENLERHILSVWYPRAVDKSFGGFIENFDDKWKPVGPV